MGCYGTFIAYGLHIPKELHSERTALAESDGITDVLKDVGDTVQGVHTLLAGDYDLDMLFLVFDTGLSAEADTGSYISITELDQRRDATWDAMLRRAVVVLGYDPDKLKRPSWIVVPDIS